MSTNEASRREKFGKVRRWSKISGKVAARVEDVPSAVVLRLAFMGRTSTEDQQDPTISIPRQLRSCCRGLPSTVVITVYFYDVECGREDLARRGHGQAHEQFTIPIPRDGGIADLLAEAGRPDGVLTRSSVRRSTGSLGVRTTDWW